jgi:hypothetical protein
MNINTSLNLKFNPAAVGRYLARHQRFWSILIVLGLLGFTGYQISRIFGVQPDQIYLSQQQSSAKVPSLRISKSTLSQLKALQPAGDISIPLNVGKQDPFSLGN